VSATALESAANSGFPFSSGKGTVVSSFNNGMHHVYTRSAPLSSGENGKTCDAFANNKDGGAGI